MKLFLLAVLALSSLAATHKPTSYMLLCRGLTGGTYLNYNMGNDNIPFCKFGDAVISAQTLGNYFWYGKTDAALASYISKNADCAGSTEVATAISEQGEKLSMQVCVYGKDALKDDARTVYFPMIEINTLNKTSDHPENKLFNEALLEIFP